MLRVSRGGAGLAGGVAALLVIVPIVLGGFDTFVATNALITAVAVMGLGVVTGRAGMISLCQVAFMAIGAWVLLWLQLHVHAVPFIVDVLIAGLVALVFGVLVGLPALRLRGVHLALMTLAFAATVDVVLNAVGFPGGSVGFSVLPPSWISSPRDYFWFCAVIFAVLAIGIAWLNRTRVGASWSAVRNSERGAAALGRGVARTKLTAFGVSALCGGLAGALLVGLIGTASETSFPPVNSLVLFALAILVGARYLEGALLGGFFFAWIPVFLSDLSIPQDVSNLLFAVGAVAGLRGGFGAAEGIRQAVQARARRRREKRKGAAPARTQARHAPRTAAAANRGPVSAGGHGAALEVRELTCHYGQVRALASVSMTVEPGTVAALIGPNGAGKSTFIDCVTGFVRSYSGSIMVAGSLLDGLAPHVRATRGVRRTFQQDRTVPDLTIEEYMRLAVGAGSARLSPAELASVLSFFDCPAGDWRVGEVDVGTRRLIEVAAAVAARPSVVLLDEPAAGLAGAESMRLAARVAEIPSRFGSAVLLVEHDMELVTAAASHIVVLDFGQVIAAGPPTDVMAHDLVVSAYLGQEFVA